MKMRKVIDKAVDDICGFGGMDISPKGQWALLLFKRLVELVEECRDLAMDAKVEDYSQNGTNQDIISRSPR